MAEPDSATQLGVHNEVGTLRTVLLHRPGKELRRLTPRNNEILLFDGLPWVDRAQEEHDAFADVLSQNGVEVLLLEDLLQECFSQNSHSRFPGARAAVDADRLGYPLADALMEYLLSCPADELSDALISGMTFEELPIPSGRTSLVRLMHQDAEFVISPLPNLLFTRDSSFWINDRVSVGSLALPARQRETALVDLIYSFHPRFRNVRRAYASHRAPVEGGDVLLLGPGVVAVGVGERTCPAGAEALARSLFDDQLAHTVIVVPIAQSRATMHLDTVCTMVDRDAVVMYPNLADDLNAFTVRAVPGDAGDIEIEGQRHFLDAAAEALGIDRLRVIDTGLDLVTAEREQWDDGNNTLALAPGLVVAYERNVETNDRLEGAGIEVVRIAGSELGSGRGGPRCMSCPIARDE